MALLGDLIRALLWTALTLFVLFTLTYDAYRVRFMYEQLNMNDFGRFYYSARAFLDDGDMYGPTIATPIQVGTETYHLWNMNPPHFHLLMLPLALLTPLAAFSAWAVLNAVALAASLRAIGRELEWRWTPARIGWTSTAVAVSSATGIIAVTGQLTFILMLPFTLAWIAARRGRWTRAAVWLGLVAGVKPFLGVFGIYFLLTRRWNAAVAMLAAIATSVAAGLLVFGWNAYVAWMRVVSKMDWAFAPMNASIEGLVSRTFAPNPIFVPLFDAPSLVRPLTLAGIVIVAAGTVVLVVRDSTTRRVDRSFALLTLAALLISPLGWMYYAWFLAGPLLALWPGTDERRVWPRDAFAIAAIPGLAAPLFVTIIGADSGWTSITIGSIYTWTLLALWCAAAADGIRANAATSPATAPTQAPVTQ